MELSKSDKKAARIIIDKALQKDYENALSGAEAILQDWRKETLSNKDAYMALYEHVQSADKQIAWRYDGLTGSRYFLAIVGLYSDGLVSDSDFELLSEQVRAAIHLWLEK